MDMETIHVVKIGGNIIDDSEKLQSFLKDFSGIKGRKILVHGGGKEATRLGETLGHKAPMIDGRRITDEKTLEIVTMVYAGLINKRIVSGLQSLGCNAIGLTGADGNLIPSSRRKPKPIDYGFVGDIDAAMVNTGLIQTLLENGNVPVLCAICHDGKGTLLNCNADTIAASIAKALAKEYEVKLTYCFEMSGVMRDINDPESLIEEITPPLFEQLKRDGVVASGMIPKLSNAFDSVSCGVREVMICNAANISTGTGTKIHL